jgi:hypothetical protein
LNLIYNTGLPGGSQILICIKRLNDYRRVDVGFSKVFVYLNKRSKFYLKISKELALGLEIFNLFNNQAYKYVGSGM